jgi:hypothetical protein
VVTLLSLLATMVPAQVTTSGRLTGIVTDAQGAVIPKAQIVVRNDQTQTEFKTTANDEGGWTIPSLPIGGYTVTVSAAGFKTTVAKDVKVESGQVASLDVNLETGGASEQVVVAAGAQVLQTESATVATTITGRQIGELPWATRDALQLVLTLPGVMTPDKPRTSSINGLPKGSVNLTLDGANIQDNFLRSSDGFFTSIQAKTDAVQEVTVTTATPGAESAGEGAVQVRFTTKSGSSELHGGAFWQYRSDAFNSNYYFNNIDGLPRDPFILRQFGGNVGGPIYIPKLLESREKAFFFVNYEYFTMPNAYGSDVLQVMTPETRSGVFTYTDSTGAIRKVNLFQLAASKGFPGTVDPTVNDALGLIDTAVHTAGSLSSRIATANDHNRLDYTFQDPGKNIRWFPTIRLDYNASDKHHFEFIHNYQHYFSDPDGVNGQINVYPGSGIVVGHPGVTGSIHRNAFSFVGAHRWTISDRLINEIRATSSGNGTSVFTKEFSPGLYDFWNGFAITTPGAGMRLINRSTQSRRNTPVKGFTENLTWLKGSHTVNFGFAYTRVASFTQGVSTEVVPGITFGLAATDPINSGGTNIFTAANFPGSTAAQRTDAGAIYAFLTGRMTQITRRAIFDENTKEFAFTPFNERNHQNEFAYYAQDSWKFRPNLTFTGGLRWEVDPSPVNDNVVYTRTGIEGVFGVSGNGNLFKPGEMTGDPTQFRLLEEGEQGFETRHNYFAPSLGFAYSPNFKAGMLRHIFGDNNQTVVRGGYSIAYTREGFNAYTSIFGANQGPTASLTVSAANNPSIFTPGGVLFRNGNFPARPLPEAKFPIDVTAGAAVSSNDFDPNLRPGYTQSWTFGLQRELNKNTVVEARYVGTHGTHLWRQMNYNEVNIFENGFLGQFNDALNNMLIFARANPGTCRLSQGGPLQSIQGTCNYGNSGLPGQVNVPIITTAINSSTDLTTATSLIRREAGRLANSIAGNLARMNRLTNPANPLIPFVTLADGTRVSNYFVANPQTLGGAFVMTNGIDTRFDALQIEFRRRMSAGLLVQASYQFGKALGNSYTSSAVVASNPRTLRDSEADRGASPWDLRHAFKVDWIYELPFGPGKPFANSNNPVVSRLVEGWQFSGVARIQSGPSMLLNSGRQTFNTSDSGVTLHNISTSELQKLVKIRKETVCTGGECKGVVFWLPDSIIQNTLAAFELGGKTLADLDPNAPYVGPAAGAGELGDRIFLYGPMQARFDLNVMKRIRITESMRFEGRVQFLNAFNRPNFMVGDLESVNDPRHIVTVNSSLFGQTRTAYRDPTVSGTNDPGGRIIEFQLRFIF